MVAVEQLVTQHLDLWTSTIKRKSAAGRGSSNKIELYGIKKLRELILELAVRGLLVPQDPSDEPASELLRRIAAEKAKLVKEGKIKKEKPLPPISEEQKPFALPAGWEWARISNVSQLITSGSRDWAQYLSDDGAIFVTMGNLSKGSYELRLDNLRFVNPPQNGEGNRTRLEAHDLLISITGEVGNLGRIPEDFGEAYINQHTCLVRFLPLCRGRYFPEVLRSPLASFQFNEPQRGVKNSFRLSDVDAITIPLPPLAEQHRIVAKVDELMALCDQLEQQTESSRTAHQTLVEALLIGLTQANNNAQVTSAWQRIASHFNTLFTTEQSIDRLKQTILQLAVMGKLVLQDPNEEPASELLKKIAAEKAKLVKERKIKKEKPQPPISEEEKPFALPKGWEWVRLGQVGICSTGKTPSTSQPEFFEGNIPFIGPGQISPQGKLLLSEKSVSEEGLFESMEAVPNDILMVCIGGSIGKAAIVDKRLAFNQQINSIRPIFVSSKYLFAAVSTDIFYDSIIRKSTGSATPIINRSKWEELLVPLSPTLEQQRITKKVDELVTLCDHLKASLSLAKTTQLDLTDAVFKIGVAQ